MSRNNEPVITTATERVKPNFKRKRLLQALCIWYLALWIVTAISPIDRQVWILENLLVFGLVTFVVATYRVFPLSDVSYVLTTLFLTLHGIGAHYTYAQTPMGFWFQDAFDLSRNHYDRMVHFSFGLLMAYPIREIFLRVANTKGFWAYYLPLDVTLAFSALFEIIEAVIVGMSGLGFATDYLGAQGDPWDAQKDMAAAAVGALICMVATAMMHSYLRKSHRVKSPVQTVLG